MKMTEFEMGKKYFLPEWKNENYFYFNKEGTLLFCDRHPYVFSFDEIISNDWQEYKEPIDYGTKESPKLMLIKHEHGSSGYWREGYQNTYHESHVTISSCDGYIYMNKKDVIKVIDLPSKEL